MLYYQWALLREYRHLERERIAPRFTNTLTRIEQSKLRLAMANQQLKSSEETIKATYNVFHQLSGFDFKNGSI